MEGCWLTLVASSHCSLGGSVTTPEFAKEEDQSIAKLQASNDIVQGAIDQQRFVRHATRAQPVLLAAEDDQLIGVAVVPPLLLSSVVQGASLRAGAGDFEPHAEAVKELAA